MRALSRVWRLCRRTGQRLALAALKPRHCPLVFSGRHTQRAEVRIEQVEEVLIDSPGVVAHADGERIGPLPATVNVDPGALKLWA